MTSSEALLAWSEAIYYTGQALNYLEYSTKRSSAKGSGLHKDAIKQSLSQGKNNLKLALEQVEKLCK